MDKNLNLILNLTEGPESKTTAQKVNDAFGQMHRTLGDVKKEASEALKLTQKQVELERQINELRKQRASAVAAGSSTAAIDARGGALTGELGRIKDARAQSSSKMQSAKDTLQQNRSTWEKESAIYEKEQERRAASAIRAQKKEEKERQKFINASKNALNGLIQLAESAAFAYAAMMNIDEKNVKKWLQWFAAIKSVSSGINGLLGTYKALHTLYKMITAARAAETTAVAANTAAQLINIATSKAACKAKDCGAGGCSGSSARSAWPANMGGGGVAPVKPGSGWFSPMAMKTSAWGLTKLAGAVGAGFALGEGFNYLRTGETLTSATIGAWNARTSQFKSEDKTRRMENELNISRSYKEGRTYNQDLHYGEVNLRRQNAEHRGDVLSRLESGMRLGTDGMARLPGADNSSSIDVRGRDIERRLAAATAAESEARSAGGSASRSADVDTRANGMKMLAEAEDQLIKKMEIEIEKKQHALDNEMRAQEKILKSAEKFHAANLKWLDKANSAFEKAAGKADSMLGGLGQMSRSKQKRVLANYDKAVQPGADLSGMKERELQELLDSGMVTNEETMQKIRQARMNRLAQQTSGMQGGEHVTRATEKLEKTNAEKKNAGEAVRMSFDTLVVEQAITVDLKTAQEEQVNQMIETLRPKIEEALKKRDELIVEAFKEEKIKELIEREIDRIEREKEAQQ